MKAQERKLRPKPSVAFKSEERARENIQVKLQSLLKLLKENEGGSQAARKDVLLSLPASQRSFNGWSSDQLSPLALHGVKTFRSNSRIALLRSGLAEGVEKALSSVVANRNKERLPTKREVSVAGLSKKLKIEVLLRQIAEEEIVRLKRHIKDLLDASEDLKIQLDAANREASKLSIGMRNNRPLTKARVVKLTSVEKKPKGTSK